jgi:hypothetical protein
MQLLRPGPPTGPLFPVQQRIHLNADVLVADERVSRHGHATGDAPHHPPPTGKRVKCSHRRVAHHDRLRCQGVMSPVLGTVV